jgi:pyruvate formate lyase activating enzyme
LPRETTGPTPDRQVNPISASPLCVSSDADSRGLVFEIRRFCLHDGPGIRTTVFFKGCPLSCLWCHNPEGRSFEPSLMYFEERCRHCGECASACPNHAIREVEGKMQTGPECQVCGTCVEACKSNARQIAGRWMTVPEIVKQVERDSAFFDESGGGVTISGGEPFYQPFFLRALLQAFREKRIHTTVETCGFVKSDLLLSLKDNVDLFLFDVKILDPLKHRQYIGVSNDLILTNLENLARGGARLVVRVPLITTVNDSEDEMFRLGHLLRELRISEVHLLPYHSTGTGKYARLKMPYLLKDLVPPSPESVQRLGEKLEGFGLKVTVGGQS